MNRVILSGNVTKNIDCKYFQSNEGQQAIATFTVAVGGRNGSEDTEFIPIKVFGKTAENCEQYLSKGARVVVEGRWHNNVYEKNGERKTFTECIANRIEFPPKKWTDGTLETLNDRANQLGFESVEDECPF